MSSKDAILTKDDVIKSLKELGISGERRQIILNKLEQRNLIPLSYEDRRLRYIVKVFGYFLGDGTLNFIGKRHDGILSFSSKSPDGLQQIREDIVRIGYTPSRIYFKPKTGEYFIHVNASSLLVFLHALGAPVGDKTLQRYRVPRWIFKCGKELKRLFLAAFFGAELSKPIARRSKPTVFASPQLEMSKEVSLAENAREFLEDIIKLLAEFGIRAVIYQRKRIYTRKRDGKRTVRFILSISSEPGNLIRLWGQIGYEYNRERQELAELAVAYLKYKQELIERRRKLAEEVRRLAEYGFSFSEVKSLLKVSKQDERFAEAVFYKAKRGIPIAEIRLPRSIPTFKQFIASYPKNNNKERNKGEKKLGG